MIAADPHGFPRRTEGVTWREYDRGILTETGIAMNPTAAFVFKCCNGDRSVGDIVHAYAERFGVAVSVADEDIHFVLGELKTQRLVVAGGDAALNTR